MAYWLGGTPPRNTSLSVPRLTPERKVRTTTSSGPGSRQGHRSDLPHPGLAQPECARGISHRPHPPRGREMNPADGYSVLLVKSLRQGTGESPGDFLGRRRRCWSAFGAGAGVGLVGGGSGHGHGGGGADGSNGPGDRADRPGRAACRARAHSRVERHRLVRRHAVCSDDERDIDARTRPLARHRVRSGELGDARPGYASLPG